MLTVMSTIYEQELHCHFKLLAFLLEHIVALFSLSCFDLLQHGESMLQITLYSL